MPRKMRGLRLFLEDLRRCKGKEEELKRVNLELANIRSQFKSTKLLKGYQKKKYVCKLLFMFLLGYNCDLGYMEAVNLLSSSAYSEKQVGYLFLSVTKDKNFDFTPLIITALQIDLTSTRTVLQNLALQFVANNANIKMADSVAETVKRMLMCDNTADFVKQTAALAFLQLLRVKSDIVLHQSDVYRIASLLSHPHLGIVTASASLIEFLSRNDPCKFESCVPLCIERLCRIITSSYLDLIDYVYYYVAAPWLTVKLLRILQNFPASTVMCFRIRLNECLHNILNKAKKSATSHRQFEHNNAKFSVIFEAIALVIQMDLHGILFYRSVSVLGMALRKNEVNYRFIALDMMTQLSSNAVYHGYVKKQWETVVNAVKVEWNVAVKKRAIDLLYMICSGDNVKPIVDQMLYFLESQQEYSEEVLLQTAALAERFSSDRQWYFDTILNMLRVCGDRVDECIWYSVIKTVFDNDTNNQIYAARASYAALCDNVCQDAVIKFACYVLGEFGHLIAKDPRSSHLKQLSVLREKYSISSKSTKTLLLTTFVKFLNLYPDLKSEVQAIFRGNIKSGNEEIQQRAVEYLRLSEIAPEHLLATVLDKMPPSSREGSAIVEAIKKNKSQQILSSGEKLLEKRLYKKHARHFISHCNLFPNNPQSGNVVTRSVSLSHIQDDSSSSNSEWLIDLDEKVPPVEAVQKHSEGAKTVTPSALQSGVHESSPKTTAPVTNQNDLEDAEAVTPSASHSGITEFSPINLKLLLDMFNETLKADLFDELPTTVNNLVSLPKFLFLDQGQLYENDVISILLESEFRKQLGKFHLKYVNKTSNDISVFSVTGNFVSIQNKCRVDFKSFNAVLSANGIIEQDIQMECLGEFNSRPSLILKFMENLQQHKIKLILPLTLNKFVEPGNLTPEAFRQRWQNFDSVGHEIKNEFTAKYPMVYGLTRQKLEGFRFAVVENFLEDAEHFDCAGIFYTRTTCTGILFRLERFPTENKYCSLVRSTEFSLSQNVSNLLFQVL